MAKCYITGLEVTVDESYLLDRGAARRAILTLKQRMAAVERLQTQLGPKDQVDRAGAPSGNTRGMKDVYRAVEALKGGEGKRLYHRNSNVVPKCRCLVVR